MARTLLAGWFVVSTLAFAGGTGIAVVDWRSAEGMRRLERAEYKVDFFELANHFESQSNQIFCGPTSATIVLNTLRGRRDSIAIPKDESLLPPTDRVYLPLGLDPLFPRYTQNNVFNAATDKVKTRHEVLGKPKLGTGGAKPAPDFGMQLRQLQAFLAGHGLDADLHIASKDVTDAQLKDGMVRNLARPGDYIIANYARKTVGQPGGGHISPVAAYDKASDSFLVLDVNPNASPWVWVDAASLISAMRTMDTVENRGFITVQEN